MTENLNKKMDYIGFNKLKYNDKTINKFNKFINNTEQMFMTSMDNYYKLLNLINTKDVLPVQMVNFITEDRNVCVWLGFYDNLLGTCDILEVDDDWSPVKYNHEQLEQTLANKPFITDVTSFVPDRDWIDWPDIYENSDDLNTVHKTIWKKYGLENLTDVTFVGATNDPYKNINPSKNMNAYILTLIEQIAERCDRDGDAQFTMWSDEVFVVKYENDKPIQKPITTNNYKFDKEYLKKLDINKVYDIIKTSEYISKLDKTNMSENFCNETYYVTWDVVYRFGFLKLTPDLFEKD